MDATNQTKRQSERVKLKLLANGIQDAPNVFDKIGPFKEEHYAYDNGNWGVERGRLVPSEIMLPGNIVSKLHVRPDSPLEIICENGHLFIRDGRTVLSECHMLERPRFWEYETSRGTPTKKLAHFYGRDCLNFNIFSGCQFFSVDMECRFCSVQATQQLHRQAIVKKSADELVDVCRLACEHDRIRWFLMTGGSYLNRDEEFDNHLEVLKLIRHELPWDGRIRGNVSLMPPKDITRLARLHELGVDHPSFNLEVYPKEAFVKFCPGKNHYVGYEHIMDCFDALVTIYGAGKTWCNFVAGLTPLADLKDGFTALAEMGVIPGAKVYHPEVGSRLGREIPSPSEDYILAAYLHAAELYNRYDYKPFFDSSVLRNSLANEAYEGLLS